MLEQSLYEVLVFKEQFQIDVFVGPEYLKQDSENAYLSALGVLLILFNLFEYVE